MKDKYNGDERDGECKGCDWAEGNIGRYCGHCQNYGESIGERCEYYWTNPGKNIFAPQSLNGSGIKKWRKELELTQVQLGAKLGYCRSTISHIEQKDSISALVWRKLLDFVHKENQFNRLCNCGSGQISTVCRENTGWCG